MEMRKDKYVVYKNEFNNHYIYNDEYVFFNAFLPHLTRNYCVLGTRHGPLDKEEVVLRIDGHDREILDRHLFAAHMSRHPFAREDSAREGDGAAGTAMPMHDRRTVAELLAAEVIALHDSGKPLALADAPDVHLLARLKQIHPDLLPNLIPVRRLETKLAQRPPGLELVFVEKTADK